MCSPAGNRRFFALASSLFAPILAGGCARPSGPLFTQLAKPPVWPAPPETARIRYVGMLTGSEDLNAAQSGGEVLAAALRGPRQPLAFSAPHTPARSGSLLAVADPGNAGVHLLDLVARTHLLVTGWQEAGVDERLSVPIGVCLVGTRMYVTDAQRHEVVVFDVHGAFQRRFGADALLRPVGIVHTTAPDRLFVVDGGAHCVVVFDLDGNEVRRFGHSGSALGEFRYPTHIAWDGGERIAVADSANFRVQLFKRDGTSLSSIGKKGDAAGDFALPKGVAFDRTGRLYVVDAQFENVQVFDRKGRLLIAFGQEGGDPGEFALPAGLAIDPENRIWVADSANHRIQVFDYVGDVP